MKRFPTAALLLAFLAPLLLLASCAQPAKEITVGLKLEVTKIERAADGSVVVDWQVDNGNVVAYLVSRFTHKIYLNGTYLGKVAEDEPFAVPATTLTKRTSKLTDGDPAAADAVSMAAAKGSGVYRIDCAVLFRIYDENTQPAHLTNSGSVPVIAK